jgi:hypothetical protein|uniref:hypothetical protein n=1 Tax=Gemmiger formicilis TaxID=745368 RepID=UPI003FEF588A
MMGRAARNKTELNENFNTVFNKTVGGLLKSSSGVATYSNTATAANYPRIVFFFTTWAEDNLKKGTLTVRIAGNTGAAEVERIVQKILYDLDGAVYNDEFIYLHLYGGQSSPVEDTDKTITRRLVTLDFQALAKGV